MNPSLPQLPPDASQTKVCRMLRTKTAFGSFSGFNNDIPWQAGESTTAVYWCLGTMETAGPDDHYCHPSTCRAGRACYAPELE